MKKKVFYIVLITAFAFSCNDKSGLKEPPVVEEVGLGHKSKLDYPEKLSEWGLFQGNPQHLVPVNGALSYELNTPLFTDYARKSRFILLPKGKKMRFEPSEVFGFPKESILVKTFYYPADFKKPVENIHLIETRLLIHNDKGWEALTYVWNEQQTDAELTISGASVDVSWKDKKGKTQILKYSVPNLVQCKSCHEIDGKMTPIGPKARNLKANRQGTVALLTAWSTTGLLDGFSDIKRVEPVPVWEDLKDGSIAQRARAWLDINCGHCHRKEGPAKNTGLYLTYEERDEFKIGIMKPPVAAGRGSGRLQYAIVPGQPERSILIRRIKSLDPEVMMPELGRKMNHREGIAAVEQWIRELN